jgi:hypothetical protein
LFRRINYFGLKRILVESLQTVAVWRRCALALARGLLIVALAGCATIGATRLGPDTPEAVKEAAVGKRAEARWQKLIDKDVSGAYEYLSPGSRATMTLNQYRGKHRVGFYRKADVRSVKCQGEVCTVTVMLTYDHERASGITTPLTEKWIIDQGQAWLVEQP